MIRTRLPAIALAGTLTCAAAQAQSVLFDFDNAPLHTSLPIDVTVNGLTAHLSATAQGFSIQQANTMGFTPAGFSGFCIYPNSVFAADLLVGFSQTLTSFSIMYAPQELGCDDSARMRVTAYMNAALVGTSTTTAPAPGTWPTGMLAFNAAQGFNNVVVHYDARPPTCTDWGPIFLADNMTVTALAVAPCSADINGDRVVDVNDLLAVIGSWGPCPAPCPPSCMQDVVADCAVNVSDLLVVIGHWGPCP